jgi:hypothetical protein
MPDILYLHRLPAHPRDGFTQKHVIKNRRELCRQTTIQLEYTSEYTYYVSMGSSVSIMSGYGLDDRAIEVRSLAEAKGFSL